MGTANRLRELREARGLAGWGVATAARVSPSLVSAIERWNYLPKERTRRKIADALGVTERDIWPNLDAENACATA